MTVTIGATIKHNKQDQSDGHNRAIKQNKQDQSLKKLKVKINYSKTHAN